MGDDFVPIVATDVPDKVRQALVSKPAFRVPACHTPPPTWRIVARASAETLGETLVVAAVWGLGVLLLWGLGALIALAVPISSTVEDVLWIVAVAGVLLTVSASAVLALQSESGWTRLSIKRHHGRYLCREDFTEDELSLLTRAQEAAEAIMDSKVNRLGLLTEIDNQAVLPTRMWEIAQLLRTQQGLRKRHELAARQVRTPELEAVLKAQQEALDRTVAAITGQVEQMEEYARTVALADSAHEAKNLVDANDEYRDLLTRSGDRKGLGYLSAEAEQVEMRLNTLLAEAAAAGKSLAVSETQPES